MKSIPIFKYIYIYVYTVLFYRWITYKYVQSKKKNKRKETDLANDAIWIGSERWASSLRSKVYNQVTLDPRF